MIWALHGAVGMAEDWRVFSSEEEGVRRVDLWKFLDCCPMPLGKFGDMLAEEICRIDPSPVLVGYSMGGRLALHALLARPDLWAGAVIVSAHPGLSHESERVLRREKDAQWSALALKGEWSDFLQQWEDQGVLDGVADLPDRVGLKNRRASVARSFIDWSLGAQDDLTSQLHKISCPVLWLTGERDGKFSQLGQSAVSHLSCGSHRAISDCGHRVPWEKPEEFFGACRDFFAAIT